MDHCDFELLPGEILGVIGDNGAIKSSLIKAVSGAVIPDEREVFLDGKPVHFTSPIDARNVGIETVYRTLAMSPALSIADTWLCVIDAKADTMSDAVAFMTGAKEPPAESVAA